MSPSTRRSNELIPVARVQTEAASRILTVRGRRVVLDSDLAEFYGVETRRLTEQVGRNPDRFPDDFAFRLTRREFDNLISQNATSRSHGGRRKLPLAFTEQGALAAAGVLKSRRAAEISVAVARAFLAMRDQLTELRSHPALAEFAARLAKLEKHSTQQTEFNQHVHDALRNLDSFIELVKGQAAGTP